MLRYIGAICIFIFTFYFVFSYEKYQKQRILLEKTFLDFLKFAENEVYGLGRPMAVCAEKFSSASSGLSAFFSSLSEGMPPCEAYRSARGTFSLSEGMDALLQEAFDSFLGDRDAVRRGARDARERCERLLDAEEAESMRRLRLFRTLTTASAMGLVILLL